eukprot:361661_1
MSTMLRRYSKHYQLLNSLFIKSSSLKLNHKLLFSTSKEKQEKSLEERKPMSNPQEEFAYMWERTTDDKIQHLTYELRKSSAGKKMAIFGPLSAILCGKMGWYQFEFLGMPFEMEIAMVHLPFTFLAIHWLSWYINMNAIHKKMNFKLPPNWKPNAGLIGGSNPEYHQLIVMNDKSNLILLDKWIKQMYKHRIICVSMFAMNMTIVMLTGVINPLNDPAIAALEPLSVIMYSCYPIVAYAFSFIIYGSPMKDIPQWKQEITKELGVNHTNE